MSDLVRDCTLPLAERPARQAELERLFAGAVEHVERVSARRLRMRLAGEAGLASRVRDLTGRETLCCSFFTFTITPQDAAGGERLTLEVEVPAGHEDVLESFGELAAPKGGGGQRAAR